MCKPLMLPFRLALAALVLSRSTALRAEAPLAVSVSYGDTSHFADAGSGPRDRETNLTLLTQHLQSLGKRWLPSGQQLKIEITDLDLAGRVPPISRIQPAPRVMKGGADWPRIALRYTLTGADGSTVAQGEESLSDMTYLQHPLNTSFDGPLVYEKRLLTRWFEGRFAKPATP